MPYINLSDSNDYQRPWHSRAISLKLVIDSVLEKSLSIVSRSCLRYSHPLSRGNIHVNLIHNIFALE